VAINFDYVKCETAIVRDNWHRLYARYVRSLWLLI